MPGGRDGGDDVEGGVPFRTRHWRAVARGWLDHATDASVLPPEHAGFRYPAGVRREPGGRVRLLPAALLVAGVGLNLGTAQNVTFLGLFVAAPLIAAALDTPRVTLVTCVASIVCSTPLLTMLSTPPGLAGAERAAQVATVLVCAALALLVNAIVVREHRRVASALGVAEIVQRAVVPDPPARVGGIRVAARYRPAQHGALVGGDLYAATDTAHGVRVIVGDVSGKGLGAAAAVAVVLGAFREWATVEPDLLSLAARVERALLRENRSGALLDRDEGFVTAVLAEIGHGQPDRLAAVCCGHPPPLLLPPDGPPRYLHIPESALPLGLGTGEARPAASLARADLPPGTLVLLYTDGVTEARNPSGEFYDPAAELRGRRFRGPDALVDAVTANVRAHTLGNLKDDTALLAVSCRPESSGPALRDVV
ncbi:SpoIIE family protein phosphatase [Streptomyces sp. B6B3]|uniref:PP2C family protein-serine/threonine phosphatase n=1 Tax=Streptomyces sp. B6B3 TaxID=3153570 RepID=UPI00325F5A0F